MTKLSDYFLSKDNEVECYDYITEILNCVIEFKNRKKVGNYRDSSDLLEKYVQKLPEEGVSKEELKFIIKNLLEDSVNFSSKMFMGFPDSGNSIAGLVGGILEATCQQNLLNSDFCARAATFVEISTIKWLRELIGYSNSKELRSVRELGGVATTGGTCSNMYGLLMARKRAYPDSFSKGLPINAKPKIFIPGDLTHYSITGAAGLLGIGTNSIQKLKTKNFSLDLIDLENQLKNSLQYGEEIIAVILNAGDSRTLTIDKIKDACNIIKSITPSCWIHIDGCHGGQLLFSHKYRDRISGIELSDSISLDPHKVFNLPYTLSYFIFRDPMEIDGFWTSSSLIMRDSWALGQMTPNIGSKSWASLKLYLMLKHIGKNDLGAIIDNRIEMAVKFRNIIKSNPNFRLLSNSSDINSVPFVYVGETKNSSKEFAYELNKKIYEAMLIEGEFYIHGFPLKDECNVLNFGEDNMVFALRYMCGNPLTEERDLVDLVDELSKIGQRIQFNLEREREKYEPISTS